MSRIVALEMTTQPQPHEFGRSQVNNEPKDLGTAPDTGQTAPVNSDSVWTKLILFLKKKSDEKKLRKEERIKRKKERQIEIASKEWPNYTKKEKFQFVIFTIIKVILFILFLYLFLLSLSLMTIGFTMVTYIALKIGPVIQFLLANPFAALSIGIIATAILQNAAATTSIAVSMVGAGIISDVKSAIPIIMGSNIGTCATNSFIALTMAGDPHEFKRAFTGATINDGFNLMTTAVLLPIEIFSGLLDKLSLVLTDAMLKGDSPSLSGANFIGSIIDPVINLFIRLDVDAVNRLVSGDTSISETALRCCSIAYNLTTVTNETLISTIESWSHFSNNSGSIDLDGIVINNISFDSYVLSNGVLSYKYTFCDLECTYWCMPMLRAFGDAGTGLFWIIFSLMILIASLFGIVKVSNLIIVGPIAKQLSRALNASFPGKFEWLTEVLLFVVSLVITLIVQSSDITTAILVPLCGIGMLNIEKLYFMTLASNVGTTITGILSAFTSPSSTLKKSMQLAFVYTFFNIIGVVFWLPIPFLRIPKQYAIKMGQLCFEYQWYIYAYVIVLYFIGPIILLGFALVPNWIGLAVIGIPIILGSIVVSIIMLLNKYAPNILPEKLKDFSWLPLWMRSLKPYDEKFKKMKCCKSKHKMEIVIERTMSSTGAIEETVLEKEVDEPNLIPTIVCHLSSVDHLVAEARMASRRNSFQPTSSDDSGSETEASSAHNEHSKGSETPPPTRMRRKAVGKKIEAIDEKTTYEL